MALTAKQILDADDRTTMTITVPQWETDGDAEVCLRLPDALEEYEIHRSLPADAGEDEKDEAAAEQRRFREMVTWLAHCLIDPATGRRLFADDQIEQLARKNPLALHHCDVALRSLRARAVDEFKALVKKYAGTASDASGSASPSTAATSTPT